MVISSVNPATGEELRRFRPATRAEIDRAVAQAARAHVARQLEVGTVYVNDFVKSDPRLPFGGVKKSGYGRELGEYGIKELTNVKTLVSS